MLQTKHHRTKPKSAFKPQQERSRQTVEAILTVARTLFSEDGVAAVSLGRIARTAALPSATIYRYFPSKDGLVAQLMNEVLAGLLSDAQQKFDRVRNIREFVSTLDKVLWDSYETIRKHPFLHEAFSALLAERSQKSILHAEHQKWVDIIFMTARRFIGNSRSDERLRLSIQVLNEMWNGTMRLAESGGKNAGDKLMKEAIAIYSRELGLPNHGSVRLRKQSADLDGD